MKTPTILKNDFGIIIFHKEGEENDVFLYGNGRLYTHDGCIESVSNLIKSNDDLIHNRERYKEIVFTEEIRQLYLELLKANAIQKALINEFLD